MKINYNRIGSERKELAAKIAEISGEKAVYLKMPTCAYQIGPFLLSRTGEFSCESWADEAAKEIAAKLAEAGFDGETEEPEPSAAGAATGLQDGLSEAGQTADAEETSAVEPEEIKEELPTATTPEAETESTALSISIPDDLSDTAYENLRRVFASKLTLMRHAFRAEALTVERGDGKITFTGFTTSDGEHTAAYLQYVTLLTKFAKEAKRVTGHDYTVENEKFAFRCFILRIGMIGAEYKKTRKILLENLTGSSSWKNGAPKKTAALASAEEPESTEIGVAINE